MELRKYKEGDEHAIIELFNLVFKRPMSIDQWLWRFRTNPAGSHMIMLMWDKDKLVGHYAVSPVLLEVNGKDVLTAHSLTTMTHPDYGRRGIFKQLACSLYEELETNLRVRAVWGYPNTNSHYAFIKKLDWKNIGLLHSLAAPADLFIERKEITKDIEVTENKGFVAEHVEILNKDSLEFSVKVKRSLEYLTWRFNEKPSTTYRIFECRKNSGELEGLMVTKIYTNSNGKTDLNIVELALKDYSNINLFISKVIALHTKTLSRITICKNLFDENHILFERIGFKPDLPLTYLGIRPSEMIPDEVRHLKNWYIAYGDSDVY